MPRALLSVYDKSGLVEFATVLSNAGYDLVASGGTEQALRAEGLAITPVEQLTGFGNMLGGRVKTLHPAIHAGILARDTDQDLEELAHAGYAPINLVVCNLYPFLQTVSKVGVSVQDAVEQIDIGGVTLLRAAAKNFFHVTTICDPADYELVAHAITQTSTIDLALRRQLATKAFAHTRDYDTAVHAYLARELAPEMTGDSLPTHLSIAVRQLDMLRYGENPHQSAAYYSRSVHDGPLGGTLLAGKALSYNNILDLDAAWRSVSSFDAPTVVIVKHLNPTGIATSDTIASAYPLALEADPLSAFGGVIAVNRPVDEPFVTTLGSLFLEAIVAPHFSDGAVSMLTSARKNCRLLVNTHPYDGTTLEIRAVHRGLLAQRADLGDPEHTTFKTITRRAPTTAEMSALQFAWKAVQHVKSNAIVIAGEHATYGISGGLPSRVDATKIAIQKAGKRAHGAVLASDAFFPFADSVEAAIAAGITAIIQPGGSIRDNEVIEKANEADIAMVFTGVRHFRH